MLNRQKWLLLAIVLFAHLVRAQTTEYIHTDALGSPVAVTNASGAVIERTVYDPYGAVLNRPLTDGPGYTGHVADAISGLNYMQQRYYDPAIGRFLSVDPIASDAIGGGNFNRYWYANNNPYKFLDLDGRDSSVFYTNPEYALSAPTREAAMTMGGLLADFTPVVGDIKGVVEAYEEPTAMNVIAATVGFIPIAGDAASAAIKSGEKVASAFERAKEIQGALKPRTQRSVTTAVAETEEGVRVVGSSEGSLRPAQRDVMQPGEVAAKGKRGTHAEVNAVKGARALGLTPTSVSPSRPACPNCEQAMKQEQVEIRKR